MMAKTCITFFLEREAFMLRRRCVIDTLTFVALVGRALIRHLAMSTFWRLREAPML